MTLRVAVVGASGSLGRALCENLLPVVALTAFVRSPHKLQALNSNATLSIVQGDARDVSALQQCFQQQDCVVCTVSPPQGPSFRSQDHIALVANIIEAAIACQPEERPRLLVASTAFHTR